MKEKWNEVDELPGYMVSNKGRLIKVTVMQPYTTKDGYTRVCLSKNGKRSNHCLHRLVAKAFIDNPDDLPAVNHLDEDKQNNAPDNLEWCTNQYNSEYSQAKHYVFISPEGIEVEIYNLTKFCKKHGLPQSSMAAVAIGKYKQCKGWRIHKRGKK